MKIVYEKALSGQIKEAVDQAAKMGKKIDYIELTYWEGQQLVTELAPELAYLNLDGDSWLIYGERLKVLPRETRTVAK
jgi:hypothetical protein